MSISIKTILDENIHRFTLPHVSFEELEKALCTIYGKCVLSIRYQDEDGDLISVSSTPELQEAVRGTNGKTLKFLLSRIEGAKGAALNAEQLKKVEQDVQAQKDAKMLAEYQRELEVAQHELKLASEEARHAKAVAAQAFWEAEEARERSAQETRTKEALAEDERRAKVAQEEADRQAIAQFEATMRDFQQQADLEQARIEAEELERVRIEAEKQAQLEAEKQAQLEAEKQAEKQAQLEVEEAEKQAQFEAEKQAQLEVALKKQAKLAEIQAFWEAEAKREEAEKEKQAAEEVVVSRNPDLVACSEATERGVVHANIQCDGCDVFPIVGTRYKCTLCPDFDLCATCEAKPNSHPIEHPLLMHKQPASTVTVHHGVTCDNCNKYPITGARFKCRLCPNFDLCEDCESKDVHPADHPLVKFRREKVRPTRGFRMGGRRCGMRGGILMQGACGPRVRKLQELLQVEADGFFGPQTEEAVKQFQVANGLTVDGIVGPQTREKLGFSHPNPSQLSDLLFLLR